MATRLATACCSLRQTQTPRHNTMHDMRTTLMSRPSHGCGQARDQRSQAHALHVQCQTRDHTLPLSAPAAVVLPAQPTSLVTSIEKADKGILAVTSVDKDISCILRSTALPCNHSSTAGLRQAPPPHQTTTRRRHPPPRHQTHSRPRRPHACRRRHRRQPARRWCCTGQ